MTVDTIVGQGNQAVSAGGTSFFAALALASMGDSVTVFTSYPQDWRPYVEVLNSLGIDVVKVGDEIAQFRIVYRDGSRKLYLTSKPFRLKLTMSELHGFDSILFGPVAGEVEAHLVTEAASLNRRVGVGLQGFVRDFGPDGRVFNRKTDLNFLKGTFLISGSSREFSAALGGLKDVWGLPSLYKVVTSGKRGAAILWENQRAAGRADPKVKSKDPTGAGDVLLASVLHYLSSGFPPERAIALATRVASAATLEVGAKKFEAIRRSLSDLSVSPRYHHR